MLAEQNGNEKQPILEESNLVSETKRKKFQDRWLLTCLGLVMAIMVIAVVIIRATVPFPDTTSPTLTTSSVSGISFLAFLSQQ